MPHSPRDEGDLTRKFDQVRVRYRWKGYLSGSMENGCWGVASGGIGHQRSFKVTTQDNLKKKCDSAKNIDKLCVLYYWKGYLSGTVVNNCWGVGRGGIAHQRSFKVIIQGHVTRKGLFTLKLWPGLCLVWLDRLYIREHGQWMMEGRQWWSRSPEVI